MRKKMTKKEINTAIEVGDIDLLDVYEHQVMTPGQVGKGIKLGEFLDVLYSCQKLTPGQIDDVLAKEAEKIREIEKRIVEGVDLDNQYNELYREKNIFQGISRKNNLSSKQIDRIIEIGVGLEALPKHQKLTEEQWNKIKPALKMTEDIPKQGEISMPIGVIE